MNTLIIDSSASRTDLCEAGKKYGTDKSPYHVGTPDCPHSHPYTAIYDLLFAPLRHKEVKLGEIGIARLASMKCWREYFPYAKLHGFEFDSNLLERGINENMDNASYSFINVEDTNSIDTALSDAGGDFDILIDDALHNVACNSNVINTAYKYLKTGGLLITEDIFRAYSCEEYMSAIEPVTKYFSLTTFITTERDLRNSEGWDNDRLLVLVRNDTKE